MTPPADRSAPTAAIIFDCDGVLVDSEVLANQVLADLLTELGHVCTAEECIRDYSGNTFEGVVAIALRKHGEDAAEAVRRGLMGRTLVRFERDLRAIGGVAETVRAFTGGGGRVAVASSSAQERIELSLRATGLMPLFWPHVYSAELVARPKPAPDIFLHAAARLDIEPGRCVVVEDSAGGVRGAREAGMRVVGFVGASHGSPQLAERLLAAGAERVITRMAELPCVL